MPSQRAYLVQREDDPEANVDLGRFERVEASDHRDAALRYIENHHADLGDAFRMRLLVALDVPQNKHPNGMPRRVHALDIAGSA